MKGFIGADVGLCERRRACDEVSENADESPQSAAQ